MNARQVIALAGIAGVVWYLARRYTSNPFTTAALVVGDEPSGVAGTAPAPTPTFALLEPKPPKPSAPLGTIPVESPISAVPDVEPVSTWPAAPLPAVPSTFADYDAAQKGQEGGSTAIGSVFAY